MTIQCCFCLREKIKGKWVDKGHTKLIKASHGYCDACQELVINKMLQDLASQVSPTNSTEKPIKARSSIINSERKS